MPNMALLCVHVERRGEGELKDGRAVSRCHYGVVNAFMGGWMMMMMMGLKNGGRARDGQGQAWSRCDVVLIVVVVVGLYACVLCGNCVRWWRMKLEEEAEDRRRRRLLLHVARAGLPSP